ncbi:MAG: hypothetical protein P8177_05455 [Gemmatimonadota bacterium]
MTTVTDPPRRRLRRLGRALLAALVAAPWAGPTPAAAQGGEPAIALGPAVVGAEDPTVGVRLRLDIARRDIDVEGTPRRLLASFQADLPVTWDSDRNPESLRASGRFGLLLALIQRPPPGPDGMPSLEAPKRWGFVEVGVEAGAEAPQRLGDADLDVGVLLAYEHDQDRLWFLPAVEIGLAYVDCVGCDLPDEADPWFGRVDARASWSIPIGAVLPGVLAPLRLRPTGRWFQAWGTGEAVDAVRRDQGTWGAVELAYALTDLDPFYEVHVGWRGGDLPIRLAEDRAWSFGFTLAL